MKFSYNWIKEYAPVKLDAREAAELLSAKSFEVKEVNQQPTTNNQQPDWILDIDILPNRPDALSHLGVARELAALTAGKFTAKEYKPKTIPPEEFPIRVEDTKLCPRYSALIIHDVKVGPSPQWLKERLESLGLKSINNIVDATNYVMLETGQPMHAFDLARLNFGGQNLGGLAKVDGIVVRPARKGERIKTLDEAQTEYELDPSVLVIADNSGPIAIAGIKGGLATGITGATKNIILESANFSAQSVRAASQKLRLRTDASIRFSYGVDPNLTAPALARAGELISEVASGKADKAVLDIYPRKLEESAIKLDPAYARSLLGEKISDAEMAAILKRLGFGVKGPGKLTVTVPTRRSDVAGPEDLIEEIGRVYGYENIKSKPPAVALFDERSWVKNKVDVPWDDYEFIRERGFVSHLLAGMGFSEVYNYSLLSDELKEAFGLEQLWELESPQSHEFKYLRPSLLPRMLLNVKDNFRFYDQVRFFETGHRFPFGKPEKSRLALVLASKQGNDDLFFEMKSAIDLLHQRLGISDIRYDDSEPFAYGTLMKWCAPGRVAEVKTGDGQALGVVGLLSPGIAGRLKIKGAVAVAEFDLKLLVEHFQKEREFEPLPKYPSIVRDISLLVGPDVRIDSILDVIEAADGGGIIEDVDVFDIYEPAPSETGQAEPLPNQDEPAAGPEDQRKLIRKSVAFHIIYRAKDRTLTDKDAERVESEVKRLLEERLGAEIR